jgi:hypothetical protein
MVVANVVHFDVVYRGSLNWRVSINGMDDHVPFSDRDACIGAATARARRHHLEYCVTTEVWAPSRSGQRECILRFMTPSDLDALLSNPLPSLGLRAACDEYSLRPPLGSKRTD